MMERYVLTAREAAYFLGISRSTLYRLTSQKRLTKLSLSNKRVGWKRSELIRFAESAELELE